MSVRIYGIRNCDTMKKAFAWLEAHKIAYAFHDYKKAGVPPGRLKEWAAKAGWEKLINARGPTWRKIPDEEKTPLNESKALKLLQQNSSAIRRPIVEAGDRLLVGFDAAEFEKLR
jgi:arsenate reductase (glutaredoxin)